MNSSTTATVHSESIQAQPVVSSQLQDQSYSSSRKLKANKIRVPFKGTEITNSDFHSVHGEEVRNSSTKTHIEFKDRGEIPRSLPNGEDINNTNTANLIFPKRVEESSAFSPREDASSHSGGLGAAPLRTSHLENTRRGESVPPFESGWWRPASETRNMKRNEIIITQHHGPSVNPLVEAISTIAKGDMPYNFQIIQTIDNTILALQTERNFSGTKLSPQGAKISVDLEDAMMKLRAFILSKNHDEKLQQLFAHTKSSAIHTTGVVVGLGKNQDLRNRLAPDAEMREKAQTSLQLAKQLGRDIIASSDFRSLIVDIIRTFHEVSTRSINPKAKSLKRDLGRVVDAFEKGESFTSLSRQMKEALIPSKSEALPQNRVGQQSVLTRDAMGNVVVAPNQTAPLNNDIEFTMTAEQQDRIAKRLRLLLARFGANENFKASATTLFHLLESMLERTSQALDNEGASVKGLKERDDIQKSWDDLKELLERFTAGRSLDPLIDLIKRLVNAVKTDEVAKQWLRDLRAYARNIWNNPQLIEDDSSVQQSRDLIRRAREILSSERYSSLTDAISKETSELAEAMKQDPQRKALAESFSRLTDTMFFSGGSISMFTIQESAAQLRHLLLPLISKQLEHIEIPQIEIYTPTHDIAFRNLIFSGSEILPHNITLDMSSGMNFNVREEGTNFARAKIMMTIRNVKLDIKNVDFYYQRKVLPKISDAGRLEMGLGGQGLSLMLEWTADLTSGQDFTLVCTRAACGIDKMNVSINSSRNFLTKVGTTLFKKQIKNALEKVVAENLVQGGIRASQSINRMVLKRKEDKLLRHKKEAMKREARAQRRLEKEANIKAKKMLKEERKLMEEQQRRIIRSDSERSASLAAQTQPVAPTVIPFATSANRSSLTASEIIAEKTAGAIPIDQVPAIGQISAMESKQPLSFSGKQETVGLPMVGSPALQRANQPIGVPLAN